MQRSDLISWRRWQRRRRSWKKLDWLLTAVKGDHRYRWSLVKIQNSNKLGRFNPESLVTTRNSATSEDGFLVVRQEKLVTTSLCPFQATLASLQLLPASEKIDVWAATLRALREDTLWRILASFLCVVKCMA